MRWYSITHMTLMTAKTSFIPIHAAMALLATVLLQIQVFAHHLESDISADEHHCPMCQLAEQADNGFTGNATPESGSYPRFMIFQDQNTSVDSACGPVVSIRAPPYVLKHA